MSNENSLRRNMTRLGAWSYSLGTSVGWGSLVVTSTTYLVQAGPAGSLLGLIVGALIMLLVSRNYAYMMRCYPEAGGAYTYAREVFGFDQAFLIGWFVALTYFAMLWANATSLPLFSRIFFGDLFSFGKLYTVFSYNVYLGEILLTVFAISLVAILCISSRKWTDRVMIALAIIFTAGISICYLASVFGGRNVYSPAFAPTDTSALAQIMKIAVISPWAFIGFESISHRTPEFSFETNKIYKVLLISVISTLLLYCLTVLLSVTVYPPQFSSWFDYVTHLDQLSGLEALPAFYAANASLGTLGVWILALSLLALIITSLIGNMTVLSRLFYSLGQDRILPERFAKLSRRGTPANAIIVIVIVSCLITLLGRTVIGWIVDVTTIGAILIYGFVSAAAASLGKKMEDKREMWYGRAGLAIMLALGAAFLIPNILYEGSIANETYFFFIVWSLLGFLFFRWTLHQDTKKRFGSSITVWAAMLAMVLLVSFIWLRQSMMTSYDAALERVHEYYTSESASAGDNVQDETYITQQMYQIQTQNILITGIALSMFGFALLIMLTNHRFMSRRSKESERIANRDPMTGVMSKHAYLVKEQEMNAAIESGDLAEFGIVVCDVNGLKKINDTLGHKAGDEYIRKSCRMICDIFKHSPIYRVGGDEFVAVLTGRDYTSRKELLTILHDTSVSHIDNNEAVVSGGLAIYEPGDESVHHVFERADGEMYLEKKLLKSLGAVTRDEESDAAEESDMISFIDDDPVIKIRRHLLIVDDSEINREIMGSMLEDKFEILYAGDGEEALEVMKEHKDEIALVLLDLSMPIMDGRGVLKAMQMDDELKLIPVIVLTADQDAEVECLKLGAMDFIPKPYPAWEIVRTRIEKCIELAENRTIIQTTERDALTKLFNIDYFMNYVKKFDQHFSDMATDALVLDVNHFHMLNERYGKSYGDMILKRIGDSIRHIAREVGGVGCRQSADIFLLYGPHQDDYTEILDRISNTVRGDDPTNNRVRLRLGVYENVDKGMDIERRFDRAKLAANTVKNNYLKAIGIYDEQLGEQALYKERLIEDFRPSIEHGDFCVYYQPKFDIRQEKPMLTSAEALVRWNHPDLGMISPISFISLLEDNGMIMELDTYVWKQTAKQIRYWKDTFGFSVPVSVNVSRIDMLMPNLKGIFQDILNEYNLSADDIILEITESAYTGDSEQVISAARELRGMGMGFRIEMDDFGTGYSSLGMLTHLPIDALKLDMTFVRNAFGETKDVRMIELIIDIADYLHVPVVAEGVETEEQYLVLKAMGCDIVQGYYFSKPVPAPEFDKFLEARKGQTAEEAPSIKKAYMSISKALITGFETLYYVDLLTDFYLEFNGCDGDDLKICPGGQDFFHDVYLKVITGVAEEDRTAMMEALKKETVKRYAGMEEPPVVTFHRIEDGLRKAYNMQVFKIRSNDDSHVMIGIRVADAS